MPYVYNSIPQNHTQVYNVYGTTEVSCWATCHPISGLDAHSTHNLRQNLTKGRVGIKRESESESDKEETFEEEGAIPLGTPLLGTHMEVRDTVSGRRVNHGRGELWLGERETLCLEKDLELKKRKRKRKG